MERGKLDLLNLQFISKAVELRRRRSETNAAPKRSFKKKKKRMHNRRSAADGEEIGVISERDYSELVNKTENEVSDV